MKIEHILKRTSQLSEIEKSQLIELRSKIFPSTMTTVQFDRKYAQTPVGYSYHGLMIANDTFRIRRYDSSHQTIKLDDGSEVVYKIINKESGARTLQVIDVCPLTAATFDRAIKSVHRMLGDSVDLLAFVGRLPFRPINMIRIPKVLLRSRAKHAYVCGKILNHQIIDERIFDLSNWDLNYSDNDMP